MLRVRGRYAQAYSVLQDALASAEATFGPGSLEAAGALNDLGVCQHCGAPVSSGQLDWVVVATA